MGIVRVKRDDYGIDLTYTVTDDEGNALNISDASSVVLKVGRYDKTTTLSKTMSFVSDGSDGQVKVSFASGDLDSDGYYDAEIQVNYSDGRRTTKTFTLHVLPDL